MAEPNEPETVDTPEGEQLPPVPDARYGAFDAGDGTTVVFDRGAEDARVRADCAVVMVDQGPRPGGTGGTTRRSPLPSTGNGWQQVQGGGDRQ